MRKGCVLNKDDHKLYRWQVSYPRPVHPFSHTETWNEDQTEQAALIRCLRWAWDAHLKEFPDARCPWDLTGAAP